MVVRIVTEDEHDLRLDIIGLSLPFTGCYAVYLREYYGDKAVEGGFQASSWSLMRILNTVRIESRDDDDIKIASVAIEECTRLIKNWRKSCQPTNDGGRRNFALAGLALLLGQKHKIPVDNNGRYAINGARSEDFYLRSFYPRNSSVDLEYESVSDRANLSARYDQAITKCMVTLSDHQVSLTEEMTAKGIALQQGE